MELVVDASMEVSLEENVEKTKVYFMPCKQIAEEYFNKSDWVMGFFYGGMVEASIFLG